MKGYEINRDYLNGWQRNVMEFFVIMMAFFCIEPILTSWIKDKITPFLLQCNRAFLWAVMAIAYIWLIVKVWIGCSNRKYVSLRSYISFALPLFCIILFYGIAKNVFPSIVFL